jgi:hypothetical protein
VLLLLFSDSHSDSLTRCNLAVTDLGAIAMHGSLSIHTYSITQLIVHDNFLRLLTSSSLLALMRDDRPVGISFSQGLNPTGACSSAFKKLHRIPARLLLSDATTSIFHLLVYLKRHDHCRPWN